MRGLGRVLSLLAVACGAIAYAQSGSPTPVSLAAKGINAVGDDLLRDFRKNGSDGNLVFSPTSISTAIAMLYGGAKGETAEELRKAMHFPESTAQTHEAYKELVASLDQSNTRCKVQCSNGLFPQQGYPILPDYLALLKKTYRAQATELDYLHHADQAEATINGWIAQATGQRIRQMNLALQPSTRLVLVNTIYFKGSWLSSFPEENTKPAPFHLLSGKSIQVNMMSQTERFWYFGNSLLQAVEIPYGKGRYAMVVLLPRRADGLPELEKHFVDNTLDFGMESLRSRSVQLYMPRFEIDSGVVRLVPALERLGVKRLFSPAQAELGGISQKPGLFINRVMHRAWIRVDEASTEAAAATLMTMVTGELPEERVSHPVLVRIDHPFLFLLRDRQTSTNLFIGRVTKPTPVVEEE